MQMEMSSIRKLSLEMNNTGEMTVAKGFLEDKTSPVVKNPSMRFQKRWPKLHEQADSNATTSGKSAIGDEGASIDAESFDDNNHPYLPARLNHSHSPELGDSTGFVLGKKSSTHNSEESSNTWETNATFGDIKYWNHDYVPSQNDDFFCAFHWLTVAKAVSCIVR